MRKMLREVRVDETTGENRLTILHIDDTVPVTTKIILKTTNTVAIGDILDIQRRISSCTNQETLDLLSVQLLQLIEEIEAKQEKIT